ncbi:MAG: helix-turn-helix transcriptional regulator [Bacteroidota bacterium]
MKKRDNLRNILGITQEDLAVLLKVSRTQLSMYELGKRDLPIAAKIQLVEMFKYIKEDASKSLNTSTLLKALELQKKKTLEQLVKENQFRQLQLEKKITAAEKKYKSNLAALQLMEYLGNKDYKKETFTIGFIKVIEAKAASELNKNGLTLLTKYQIEKEVLQAEEKILTSKINS